MVGASFALESTGCILEVKIAVWQWGVLRDSVSMWWRLYGTELARVTASNLGYKGLE